jgi:hypothetical protein
MRGELRKLGAGQGANLVTVGVMAWNLEADRLIREALVGRPGKEQPAAALSLFVWWSTGVEALPSHLVAHLPGLFSRHRPLSDTVPQLVRSSLWRDLTCEADLVRWSGGRLLLDAGMFDAWLGSIRRRGRFPSHAVVEGRPECEARIVGRPSQLTGAMRSRISQMMDTEGFRAARSPARHVVEALERSGRRVSIDTVQRWLKRIAAERGDGTVLYLGKRKPQTRRPGRRHRLVPAPSRPVA